MYKSFHEVYLSMLQKSAANGDVKASVMLALQNLTKDEFELLKDKLIERLNKHDKAEKAEIKKALHEFDPVISIAKATGRAYHKRSVGEKFTLNGQTYIKVSEHPAKYKPYYESNSRGAKLAAAAIEKKIRTCKTPFELANLVKEQRQRFGFVNESEFFELIQSVKGKTGKKAAKASTNKPAENNRPSIVTRRDGVLGKTEKEISYTNKKREKLFEKLKNSLGEVTNLSSGIKANLSKKSLEKMSSEKAIEKSKDNGFTVDEHFEVAEDIIDLYKNSKLIVSHKNLKNPDDPNILSIKRFVANTKLSNGTDIDALITVKESKEHGHRIYSLELDEINKASDRFRSLGDAVSEETNRATKTPYVYETNISQSEKKSISEAEKHTQEDYNKSVFEVIAAGTSSFSEEMRNAKTLQDVNDIIDRKFSKKDMERFNMIQNAAVKWFEENKEESNANLIKMKNNNKLTEKDIKNLKVVSNKEGKKNTEPNQNQGIAKKLRDEFNKNTEKYLNKEITNKSTGIKAVFSKESQKELRSRTQNTKDNGFTLRQHFEVANNIIELFENATLEKVHDDVKHGNAEIKIERFLSKEVALKSGQKVQACITVKHSLDKKGRIIYSIEAMDIKNALEKTRAKGQPPKASLSNDSNVTNNPGNVNTDTSNRSFETIKSGYSKAKSITGNKKTLHIGNEKIKCHYKIVEAETPTASHDEKTYKPTAGFPTTNGTTANDRNYETDKDAQESVRNIAAEFDGRAISDCPIVTKDGIVLSGNNRTMSSKLAALKGTDKAYLESLKEECEDYGFEPDDLKGFKHPRIILEMDEYSGSYSTQDFAKFNKDEKKTMNNTEKAVKTSKIIKENQVQSVADVISEYDTLSDVYNNKKAAMNLATTLVQSGIIERNELAQYYTEDEGFSPTGKDFVENTLVGSVLNESNIRGVASEGGKVIRQKLVRAILPLIENKGTGNEYSFNNELNDAVKIAVEVSKNHDKYKDVKEYVSQGSLFGDKVDDLTAKLAEIIHDSSQKDFSEKMKSINAGLRPAAAGQFDMFCGECETKESVLSRFLGVHQAVKKALASVDLSKESIRKYVSRFYDRLEKGVI